MSNTNEELPVVSTVADFRIEKADLVVLAVSQYEEENDYQLAKLEAELTKLQERQQKVQTEIHEAASSYPKDEGILEKLKEAEKLLKEIFPNETISHDYSSNINYLRGNNYPVDPQVQVQYFLRSRFNTYSSIVQNHPLTDSLKALIKEQKELSERVLEINKERGVLLAKNETKALQKYERQMRAMLTKKALRNSDSGKSLVAILDSVAREGVTLLPPPTE